MRNPLLAFGATSLFLSSLATIRADTVTPDSLCTKNIKIDDYHFDISSLMENDAKAEHMFDNQPAELKHEYIFNLCRKIAPLADEPNENQCGDGTFFCERVIMTKPPKITEPLVITTIGAGNYNDDPLGLSASAGANSNDESTASSLVVTMKSKKLQAIVTLECSEEDGTPTYVSETQTDVIEVKLNWKTKTACGQKQDITPPPDGGNGGNGGKASGGMSGWKIFLIIFFVGFGLYFGLGALYNSRTYNARGWDLLPHSDFWREFPYLIKDFVMAVYNSFSSRRHGGYMSV